MRYEPDRPRHHTANRCCCWLLAPLLSGCIRNWKAKLQNRRGPRIWQPYLDLVKFLRKDMVISEHASWIFRAMPYVLFISTLLAGLMVPLVTASGAVEPVRRRAGVRRPAGAGAVLPGAGRAGPGQRLRRHGQQPRDDHRRHGRTGADAGHLHRGHHRRLDQPQPDGAGGQGPTWKLLNPAHVLAFAALFIVLLAETGRIPVDNPATHLELTMIHEAMILEYSGRYLALIEWGASIKQLVLMALLVNIFFPVGIATD